MFNRAENTFVQGSTLTAVGGDQHIEVKDGPAIIGHGDVRFASDQYNYTANPLKDIDLLHRYCSPAALLDANARLDQPKCMPGTREAIIKEIMDWVKSDEYSGSMIWLRGPAGAGKTAIEHTIAERCKREGLLIGTFFFSRAVSNCTDGNLLIPTLAYQLVTAIPEIRRYIKKATRKDPHLFAKSRETQMKELIVEPLRRLSVFWRLQRKFGLKPFPRLIAIDGLDECSNRDVQCNILKVFSEALRTLPFPTRVIVASRPEPHISRSIERLSSSNASIPSTEINLREDDLARRDIKLYLETRFQEVRQLHSEVREDWPAPEVVLRLVDKTSGQFIYASTVMAYITSPYHRPDDRLKVILLLSPPPSTDKPFAQLDCLYSFILRTVQHLQDILRIMTLLIGAKGKPERDYNFEGVEPFPSVPRIESMLRLREGDVRRILTDMHSLVDSRDTWGISLLHASFPDFLMDRSRSDEFFIDIDRARATFEAHVAMDRLSLLEFSDLVSRQSDSINSSVLFIASDCESAGMSDEFALALQDFDLFKKYDFFLTSNPWRRASATAALKRHVTCFEQYLGTLPLDVNKRLRSMWGHYQWGPFQYVLRDIAHSHVFALVGPWLSMAAFLGYLSIQPLPPPPGRIDPTTLRRECYISLQGAGTIIFSCRITQDSDLSLTIAYDRPHCRPLGLDLTIPRTCEEQEAWAWRIMEDAYYNYG